MLYHSTRSTDHAVDARTAIVQGLSDDGGLFVSDALGEKKIDLATLANESYSSLAVRVLSILLDDFSTDELTGAVERAYRGKFATEEITPVTPLGRDWLLELYHGPTSAFKDLALCLLPQLMSLGLKDKKDKVMIATATSGDTGKAALAGFQDVKDIGIAVFYPEGKVSDIQRLQMVTQAGENVAVASVTGNFDDVQSAVKELFQKGSPRADVRLSSANSINIGRLAPQVVYYFDAYRQLLLKGAIQLGDEVDFAALTGNFGDVLAGYFAKLMGLPVRRLVVASNANHVLTDFLLTGVYDRRRNFEKTISPSMDILISSNLERLLYYVSGKNTEQVAAFMKDLKEEGVYQVPANMLREIQHTFFCGFATDDETRETIREVWEKEGRVIDPHTAVAVKVAREVKEDEVPMVVLSTASPYKFSRDVYGAIVKGGSDGLDDFAVMAKLQERTKTNPPVALSSLREKPVRHTDVLEVAQMDSFVEGAMNRIFK